MPIDYLDKNPKIKGLLIYHYLGTGKTYTSIGFAERYYNQKYKVVIFIPGFLRAHWQNHLKSYGVKNYDRYEIIAHKDAKKLVSRDLSKTILVVDEMHRIIKNIEAKDASTAELYSKCYLNLKKSKRILLLTGTPIYHSFTDIAYQINMFVDNNLLPYNKEEFKLRFTKIHQTKATLVGHAAQSQVMLYAVGMSGLIFALPFASLPILALSSIASFGAVLGTKYLYPINNDTFRYFNTKKLDKICSKYISYYAFKQEKNDLYPTKKIHYSDVKYNAYHLDFLIRFADNQLNNDELVLMGKDYKINFDPAYINLNSTRLHKELKRMPGCGLEIGNLFYRDSKNANKIVYPSKFDQILKTTEQTKGQVVIYSHFYHNGILLFKKYLDAKGYKGQYRILYPDSSIANYNKVVNDYNQGKYKLLLLHPTITVGVSLKGTQQLHILEAPYNRSVLEQVVGRAVRFRSHIHLPKNQRMVNVYIWEAAFGKFDLKHAKALRENWNYNFSEMNYYGDRAAIDDNTKIKATTPDSLATKHMRKLEKGLVQLGKLLQDHSIEKRGYK